MGLIEAIGRRLFKSYLANISDLRKSIGTEVYNDLLKAVRNRAVYPEDNIESYVRDGYLFNPLVYSIVSFIAQKAGSIPWGVYDIKNDKALRSYKSANTVNLNTKIVKTKALVANPDHELNAVFLKPNALQGWAEFMEQLIGFKLITGNSYIQAIGPTSGVNTGLVKELWIIPSQIIRPIAGDRMQPVRGYKYLDSNDAIPPEQIIHLKYWTPEYFNGQNLIGLSPIRAARRLVTKSNASFDSMTASLQNQGIIGVLTPKEGTEELTEEQQDMLERRFARKTGSKNSGRTLISNTPLTWQQIGMSPVDLNIIESDRMDLRTLCNVFHVPSELFNDAANKTYSNTKEAGSAVYTNAVLPALNQFRDAFNKFIAGKYPGIYVDYDASMVSELQDDLAMMTSALSGAWWITPNERRDIMNFPADEANPQLDDYWVPAGLMPMSQSQITDEVLDETMKRLRI